jgi:methyl-accepting chemotaxis protein
VLHFDASAAGRTVRGRLRVRVMSQPVSARRLRSRTTGAIAGIAILVAAGTVIEAGVTLRLDQTRAAAAARQVQASAAISSLATLQKQAELDIVQVQASLYEVAATRGQGAPDGGFAQADRHARALSQDITEARKASAVLSAPQLAAAFDRIGETFIGYYSQGQKAAHTYVDQGPAAGNVLAPDVDRQADMVMQAVAQSRVALESQIQALDAAEKAERMSTDSLQRLALAAAAGCALTAAAGLVLLLATLRGRLFAPLALATASLRATADGQPERHSVSDKAAARNDEIGDLSRAVALSCQAAVDRAAQDRSAAAQDADAAESRRLTDEINARALRDLHVAAAALGAGLARLSAGDLTCRLDTEFTPDHEHLREHFNAALGQIGGAMRQVAANAAGLDASAQDIARARKDLAMRTEQQAVGLAHSAKALEQITSTVREAAAGAKRAHLMVSEARGDAARSGEVVSGAVAAMGQIEDSSRQISQILSVIDEIAFQTNLLALNAGVEAARAGDAGRGFAVVAAEVRALAQRSAQAAKEIKALISSSTQQVGQGVRLVGETGAALGAIAVKVTEIDSLVAEIAAAAQEQAGGLHQVGVTMTQMDQGIRQNAALIETIAAASASLNTEIADLDGLTARFEVGDAHLAAPAPRLAPAGARPAPSAPRAMTKMIARHYGAAAPRDGGWEKS